jgi:hypothetical protein
MDVLEVGNDNTLPNKKKVTTRWYTSKNETRKKTMMPEVDTDRS